MGTTSYTFDPLVVVTAPGGNHWDPFSPPADFAGAEGEYLLLLRMRYRNTTYSRYFRERVEAYNRGAELRFEGPFASQALSILARIGESTMMKAS